MADSKFIKKVKQLFNVDQVGETEVVNDQNEYRSMSNKELKTILKGVYVPDNIANRQVIDKMMLPSMLEPLGKELLDKQLDNSKLLSLAPEIEQAASILIPSILSPNDFRKNIFKVELEMESLDETARIKITELLDNHFGEVLSLSTKLSIWLDEAIFKVGSKAVMVFPTNSIGNIVNKAGSKVMDGSVEGIVKDFSAAMGVSLIPLNSVKVTAKMKNDSDFRDLIIPSLESAAFEYKDDPDTKTNKVKVTKLYDTAITKADEIFSEKCKLTYTDDPRILFQTKFSNAAAMESINKSINLKLGGQTFTQKFMDREDGIANSGSKKKKIGTEDVVQYQTSPYLDLSEYINDGKPSSYPAMIEIPSESVIPIIVDGSPDNHIGYFVLLNEQGNPISATNDTWQDMQNTASGDTQVNQLFNSFYGSSQFTLSKMMAANAKTEIVSTIYESYVRNLLTSKLEDQGFNGVAVQMNNDVSRVMLYRLLKNTETRVLFVPKQLMNYLAFDYNKDGTGRSKIEQIKFPLSLKITLIITRLIGLIEASVNRTKLNVTLDDSIGNPLEVLRSVRREVLKSKMYGISYDPSTIIKGIVEKSLTVVPDKIPGVEAFSITEEPNNVTYPTPDDALLEEINNMYMLSLDVPPSAMNRLSEDEFSRSVASNNIFFSNKIKEHQTTTCKFMTQLIRTYIKHSSKLKSTIGEIIKTGDKTADGASQSSSGEATTNAKDRLQEVIERLKFTLPSPSLAIDRSSFEELREYIEIIEQVLVGLFPPELTSNSELADTIATLKSNVKHKLLMEHIQSNSILSDLNFDALGDVKITDITTITQKLMNLKAALELQKAKFGGGEGEVGDAGAEPADDSAPGGAAW